MQKELVRKVKLGRAKDYRRDAKLYTYGHITYKNKDIMLRLYGWDAGEPVLTDNDGRYIEYDGNKIYLDFSNC